MKVTKYKGMFQQSSVASLMIFLGIPLAIFLIGMILAIVLMNTENMDRDKCLASGGTYTYNTGTCEYAQIPNEEK